MKIVIDVETTELNENQRRGLAMFLDALDGSGFTISNGNAGEAVEPTPIESAPSAPKRRTRKKAEPKPETETPTEESPAEEPPAPTATEEPKADEAPAPAEESAESESNLEELRAKAVDVASPIIRKSPAMKDKVREILAALGVEKITEMNDSPEKLQEFIERVQQIKA